MAKQQLARLHANKPSEGTHNLVVFDPSTINIIRRYGVPGVMTVGAGAGAAASQEQ